MREITTWMMADEAASMADKVKDPSAVAYMVGALNNFAIFAHASAVHPGWWDTSRNFGELVALIHSEVSEAMEGGRKDKKDDHLPQYTSVAVELADAVIRIGDLAGVLGIPLGEVVLAKMKYNSERADHRRENRAKEGGKQF